MTKTFKINEVLIPKMQEYIGKINARAQKIGQPHIEAVEVERTHTEQDDGSFECFVTFEVYGETPKVNGWTFIARIEHDPDIGSNILRVAPGQTLPREFWEAKGHCNHCNTKRTRRDTFVLREDATGEYKQIGRLCVRDFIGYDNPADMYWWLGAVDGIGEEAEGWEVGGMRSQPLYRVERLVAEAIASIRLFGYRSRRMVEEGKAQVTTASYMHDLYTRFPYKQTPQYVTDIRAESNTAETIAEAELVINWIKGWDEATKQKSEFNFNINTLVSREYCRGKDFGMIACLHTMYLKEMDMLKAKVVRSNLHVGEVGQKIEFRVTIKSVFAMDGYYGVSYLILMEDEAGNCFKWVASRKCDFDKDEVVTVKGTIKEHSEYKGRNQTVLTRCKMSK